MIIFEEIPWFQFQRIPSINKLPLQEQVRKYREYMLDLHYAREQWMVQQHEGKSRTIISQDFLQQEDLYYILQEDGSKIYVTVEI